VVYWWPEFCRLASEAAWRWTVGTLLELGASGCRSTSERKRGEDDAGDRLDLEDARSPFFTEILGSSILAGGQDRARLLPTANPRDPHRRM
jgi:hypothetical protein